MEDKNRDMISRIWEWLNYQIMESNRLPTIMGIIMICIGVYDVISENTWIKGVLFHGKIAKISGFLFIIGGLLILSMSLSSNKRDKPSPR